MMTKKTRVVITGSGITSSSGNDVETYCKNLYAGRYGIAPITTYDTSKQKTKIAATLDPIPQPKSLSSLELRTSSKLTLTAIHSVEQAVEQSKIDFETVDSDQVGIIVGSGHINIYDLDKSLDQYFKDDRPMSPRTVPVAMAASAPSQIAITFGINGVVKMVSTACASGFTAISDGVRLIQDGHQQLVIAGGVDLVVCNSVIHAWEQMRVVSSEPNDPALACRPFHQDRGNIVLGDGAAFFVLESYESAIRRGATILAEISGAFQNSDSVNLVKPQTEHEISCIEQALKQADISTKDIGMIFAHATGTQLNDSVEVESLSHCFGPCLAGTPMCGLKAMIGHTMGASGPMALIAALGTLNHGYFYPVPNLTHVESGMDICTTLKGRKVAGVEHILLNAFAFGGTNVCLVISKGSLYQA